jgi:hypothetical protein
MGSRSRSLYFYARLLFMPYDGERINLMVYTFDAVRSSAFVQGTVRHLELAAALTGP